MAFVDRIARLHYRTLLRERGAWFDYRRHNSSEPVRIKLPVAGHDRQGFGETDPELTARVLGLLGLADELLKKLGRMPEPGDTLTRCPEHSDTPVAAPDNTQTLQVFDPEEGGRGWRPFGAHGGLVRIDTTIE